MWPRITIIGTGQDVQVIRAFGPRSYRFSIDWPPPRNLDDGLLAQEKLGRPTRAQRLQQDGYPTIVSREDERGSVCKGAAAAMGDAGDANWSLWISLTKQRCKGNRSYECSGCDGSL